jgi:ComEC/Rec2-related protein
MSVIRNKAAVVGFSYFSGIAAANFAGVFPAAVAMGCCLVTALVLGVLRKAQVYALILLALGLGLLSFTIYDINTRQPVFEKAGEAVNITGTVEEKRELGFYQATYLVKTDINGKSTKILLTAPDAHNINVGDEIESQAVLSELRDTAIFPERSYNLSRGVLLKGGADSVELVRHGSKSPIDHIRDYNTFIQGKISAAFPNEIGGLLRAVFFGDKSGLSGSASVQAQSIRVAGVAHYTAVSGLHMTMITHMFMLVFGLTAFRNNRRVKFAVLVCVVAALAIFFNLTMSVTRAAIMLIICYGGELFMRKGSTVNSLGFALLLILLLEPYAVFDAGLIMSFSGTFGVGVVAPAVTKGKKINRIVESFIVSACASLCVLPASALFFGGISVLSPLTSVIIIPFFTVAAGAIVLYSVFAPLPLFLGSIGQACLLVAGIMSKIMNEIIGFFGKLSGAWISLDYWFVPLWSALAIAAIVVIRLICKSNTKAVKAACLTVAALALMICVYNMNSVNSGRTYIKIYSDSVSAWAIVRQGNTEAVIVTADTPRAYEQISHLTPTVISLLKSTRNNAEVFGGVTESAVYNISGKFVLDIHEDEAMLEIGDFSILFTRAANDNASPANVTVAYNQVRKKRDFDSDCVVYVSRSVPIEHEFERNAYYEPVYLIIM